MIASRRRIAPAFAGALILSLLGAAGTADAHSAKRFKARYSTDPDFYRVQTYFDNSVPGGKTRSRIANGARVWTDQKRQVIFSVNRKGIKGKGSKVCETTSAGRPKAVIYWKTIDGLGTADRDTLGRTSTCRYQKKGHPLNGRIGSVIQTYDSKQNWYRGTGNVPVDRYDMWSVAVHEWGHAVGWTPDHYGADEDTELCSSENLARETMCALTYPGQSRTRDLGEHDKHTFKRVYGPR